MTNIIPIEEARWILKCSCGLTRTWHYQESLTASVKAVAHRSRCKQQPNAQVLLLAAKTAHVDRPQRPALSTEEGIPF